MTLSVYAVKCRNLCCACIFQWRMFLPRPGANATFTLFTASRARMFRFQCCGFTLLCGRFYSRVLLVCVCVGLSLCPARVSQSKTKCREKSTIIGTNVPQGRSSPVRHFQFNTSKIKVTGSQSLQRLPHIRCNRLLANDGQLRRRLYSRPNNC